MSRDRRAAHVDVTYARRVKLAAALPLGLALGLGLVATPARADDTDDCSRNYELAQRSRQQSKLVAARSQLLVCAQDRCPAVLRKDCVAWLAEVNAALPAIAVQARGNDGCDRPLATVWLDGTLVPRGAEGRPIDLDPGPHGVRVDIDSSMVEQTVVVSAGDRARVVTLSPAGPKATCGAPAGSAAGLGPPAPPPDGPPHEHEGARPVPALVYVLGGVGLVGLGVGAGFGIGGLSQKSTLDQCKGSCSNRDVDTMQRTFLVSDIATGVGIVALAAATIVYLTR